MSKVAGRRGAGRGRDKGNLESLGCPVARGSGWP